MGTKLCGLIDLALPLSKIQNHFTLEHGGQITNISKLPMKDLNSKD